MEDSMLNKTFSRLTVIERIGPCDNSRWVRWRCSCTCGNEAIVAGTRLRTGRVKSCGCLRKDTASKTHSKYFSEEEKRVRLIRKSHNYRASKHANGGQYTAEEWISLCNFYDNRCMRCAKQIRLTVDHIIPISRGGRNSIDNLQPLCESCNKSKGNREDIDYRPAAYMNLYL